MNIAYPHRPRLFSIDRTRTARILSCQLVLACALIGCEDASVQEEQIAKGVEEIPASAPTEPSAPENVSANDTSNPADTGFAWTAPDGWVLDETPRQMRIATYMAPTPNGQQEIAITRFPGQVGGVLANINRWRGQMGLAPISESGLEEYIERFSTEGFEGYQVRIESERGVMLAAGVFDSSIEQTWFVRATTSDASVADAIESDVFAMARSFTQ
jgi:hypothetical protein